MKNKLLSSSRTTKQFIAAFADFFSIVLSTLLALYISSVEVLSLGVQDILKLLWFPCFCLLVFIISGVYRSVLRYIDFSTIYLLIRSMAIVFLITLALKAILSLVESTFGSAIFFTQNSIINSEGWIIGSLTSICLIIGIRIFAHNYLKEEIVGKRVVIYGAGNAGIQLAGALRLSSEMQPIAFIDNNKSIQKNFLGGLKVLPPRKLRKLVSQNKVDEVLIAIPSASKSTLRDLLKEIEDYSIKVRILPGLSDLAQGKVLVSELKEVDITDLLGRYEVEADKSLLNRNIRDKVVLITGAGGSIGSEIAKQVAINRPKKLVLLDSNEYSLYTIRNQVEPLIQRDSLYSLIGNVTNKKRILEICKTFKVDTIYHSAAYKHVPLVEENPFEGVINNIFGTKSCVEAAIDSEVETFVLISTDKAVRPTNIMGATKRFTEMILQSYSDNPNVRRNTRMTMVRFGNVLGSSGSAIPMFQQQIKDGGPVTVTDPEVIRYFMSIPEAAELVIQAGAMGEGGDVFVLDMGEPVKIYELAKRLINLSGLELKDKNNPSGDIEIIFTGLRPGEKLFEELLIGDNVCSTTHKQILRAEEVFISKEHLEKSIKELRRAEENNDVVALKKIFKKVIDGYQDNEKITDVISIEALKE